MDEIFGLSTLTVMWIVVAIAGVAAGIMAVIWWRKPVLARMGIRNMRRRRAQTALIVLGLTIATIIVTMSFAIGDTLAISIENAVFSGLRRVDHMVTYNVTTGALGGEQAGGVPQELVDDARLEFGDDEQVDAVFGVTIEVLPALHPASGQIEPSFWLIGVDAAAADSVGAVPDADGDPFAVGGLAADEIVINPQAAEELDAGVGDTIVLRVRGEPHSFRIVEIGEPGFLTGDVQGDSSGGVLSAARARELVGQADDDWALVVVSGAGGIKGALDSSAALDEALGEWLKGQAQVNPQVYASSGGPTPLPRFQSEPIKADALETAELIASIFTALFLFMGSFSVAAGILLIFLLFAMLAEERRSEMGMARAVGMQRDHLIQMFMSEGMTYNLAAAAVGVALGVALSVGMVSALNGLFATLGFSFTYGVTLKSLIISAGLGIVVTFITVTISSFRASQLNIVAAIRDIPDSRIEARRRISIPGIFSTPLGLALLLTTPITFVAGGVLALVLMMFGGVRSSNTATALVLPAWRLMRWRPEWWATLLVAGALVIVYGVDLNDLFLYMLGISIAPIGLVMLATRLGAPGRPTYTVATAFVVFLWFAPLNWHQDVWGTNLEGGPQLFVLSGILLTTAATLLLVFNLNLVLRAINVLGVMFGRLAPVVRTAAAYPAASRYRTGMTIAMIAIITFALVNFSTISASFDRAFTTDDALGGFQIVAATSDLNEVGDIPTALREAGETETLEEIEHVGRLRFGAFDGTGAITLSTEEWDIVNERPVLRNGEPVVMRVDDPDDASALRALHLAGANDDLLIGQEIKLQSRARGYSSDEAVWDALRRGDPVAIATASALTDGGFGGPGEDAWRMPDSVDFQATVIPEVLIRVSNGARFADLQVIAVVDLSVGILDVGVSDLGQLPTVLVSEGIWAGLYDDAEFTRHLVAVRDGADSHETAQAIERALAIEAVDIQGDLEQQREQTSSFFLLFQAFIGLGLVAGLAALGVIAVRAVVERRQQIGVLRAIGFQSRMVGLELMIEMGFIAFLGIGLGTVLAIGLAWKLFAEGTFGSDVGMYIPLGTILPIIFGSFAASLVLTYFPARQATRIPVAEALRYE